MERGVWGEVRGGLCVRVSVCPKVCGGRWLRRVVCRRWCKGSGESVWRVVCGLCYLWVVYE